MRKYGMSITGRFMKNCSMDNPTCVVCGKQIGVRFYLCSVCEKTWGRRKRDWPEWLRFLVNDEKKERMRELRGYYDREISFSDYPEIDNMASTDVM